MADNNEILFKVTVDAKDGNQALKDIKGTITELNKEVKKSTTIFGELEKFLKSCFAEFKQNTSSVDNFIKALNSQNQAVNTQNRALEQTAKTVNNYNAEVHKINNSQKQANKTFEEGSTNIEKIDKSTKTYAHTVNTLETRIKGSIQALQSNNTAIEGNIKALTSQNTQINSQNTEIKKLTGGILAHNVAVEAETNNIKANTAAVTTNSTAIQAQNVYIRNIIKDTKDAEDTHKSFRNTIFDLTYAWRGFTEGIKIALNLTFTEWSREFDKNMRNVNSIALESVENFNYLRNALIEIQKQNNYTGLVGLSNALYEAYSAGFKMKEALELVKEADRGALAGLAETKDVLKALVSVIHSFGLNTSDAARLNDIFLKTVQDGILTMPELVRYIGQASTIAPELGLHIEDVAAAFVQMTRQGLNAAESTTAINSILKTFLDPSKEASKYAKELGINLSASAFEGKNFAEVIADISKKGDTDAIGKVFGNVRAIKGFFKLAKDEGEQFIKFNKEFYDKNLNTTTKASEEQRKSFDQSITRLKNAWEQFMLVLGDSTQKVLLPLIEALTNLLRGINNFPQALKDFGAGFILATSAMGGTVLALGSVKLAANVLAPDLVKNIALTDSLAFSMKGLGIAALYVASAFAALKIGEGIGEAINLYNDKQGEIERYKKINQDRATAKEKVDMYQGIINNGRQLNPNQKMDYARAMVQSDPNNSKIAQKLAIEAQAEMNKDKVVAENKNKLTKEQLDTSMKYREEYAKEEQNIDNAIEQAGEDTLKKRILRTSQKYDKLISDAENFLKIKNNVTDEERAKAEQRIIDLKIAKEKELQKQKDDYAEKERLRQERELKKREEAFKKQIEYQIKLQNNKQKNLEEQRVKGLISDDEFLLQGQSIESAKESIYGKAKQTAKVRGFIELAEEFEGKRHDAFLKFHSTEVKIKEDDSKREFERINKNNDLTLKMISAQKSLGSIGNIEALNREIEQLGFYQNKLQQGQSKAPTNSKTYESYSEKLETTSELIVQKNNEINKALLEQDFETAQIYIQKQIDDNETLKQLKLKSDKDYLQEKIKIIDQEISIEKDKKLNANIEQQAKIQANIDKLENQKKLAQSNLTLNDEQTIMRYKKQTFDDDIKHIETLKALQIYNDKQVLDSKKQTVNDYLSFLKSKQSEMIAKGQGAGGSIGGILGTEDYQQITNQIKNFETQKLMIVLQTNELIRQDEEKTFKFRLDMLGMLSQATNKLGESLVKSMNDSISVLGTGLTTISNAFTKSSSLFSSLQGIEKQKNNSDWGGWSGLTDKQKQENQDLNNLQTVTAGLQIIEILSESIDKGTIAFEKSDTAVKKYSNSLKLFGKDSKEAGEAQQFLVEAQLEQIKVLPIIGDLLYKITRGISDAFGGTISEKVKKDNKDIENSYINLSKTKLTLEGNNLNAKLDILSIEKNQELKKIEESITNEEALNTEKFRLDLEYQEKKRVLFEQYSQKEYDIEVNLIKALRGLKQDSYEGKLQDLELEYNKNYNKILNSTEYSDEEQKQKDLELLTRQYNNTKTQLALEHAKQDREIEANLQKSKIELQQDSLEKSLALQRIKYQQDIADLNDQLTTGKLSYSQYYDELERLKNENSKAIIDINKTVSDKIRSINEKNYNEELKAYEALNKDKTNKLKSELQKQYDIINDYQNKIQELTDKRNEDASLKQKRLSQFQTDLQNKQAGTGADFYRQNLTEFNLYSSSKERNANDSFDFGKISADEKRNQLTQLALEKYLYYQSLAEKTLDPEQQEKYRQDRDVAQKQYYDNIFDKEKEAIELEKTKAERRKTALEQEIQARDKAENSFILSLDAKYKDAAGLYRNSFVEATKDWIAFAQQEGLQKLGYETYKTLEQVGNNLNKNKESLQGLTGSSVSNTSNTSFSGMQPIQQASSLPSSSTTSKNSTSKASDLILDAITVVRGESIDKATRQNILNNVYNKLGASAYEKAYKMSDTELIAMARNSDIPLMAKGSFFDKPTFVMAGEAGGEALINSAQIQTMYKKLIDPTVSTQKSSIISVSMGDINITASANADTKELSNLVEKKFNDFANSITRATR